MALFDEISKKISDASQSVAQKGKEMTDSIRINSLISEENKKVSSLYATIGEKYIAVYEGKYDPELQEYVDSVRAAIRKIDELNARLQEMKSTAKCSACGAENPKTGQFCASCGNAINSVDENDDIKKCAKCGATLNEGLRFCTSCGHPVDESKGE